MPENAENAGPRMRSGLPSKEQRMKKDPFADTVVVGTKPSDEQLQALAAVQATAGEEWKAGHDADAPRREQKLKMCGNLDGACCRQPGAIDR